jgi:CheY-like chemotaxis protein
MLLPVSRMPDRAADKSKIASETSRLKPLHVSDGPPTCPRKRAGFYPTPGEFGLAPTRAGRYKGENAGLSWCPLERPGSPAKDFRPSGRKSPVSTSVLIFVVEDNPLIQQLLDDTLTDGGYAVRAAATGEEAIALLDEIGADFQALITDVDLAPGKLTGWDVARHAREITADLPVIYMTGASGHEWASKGVPKSMLMNKPLHPHRWLRRCRSLSTTARRRSATTE